MISSYIKSTQFIAAIVSNPAMFYNTERRHKNIGTTVPRAVCAVPFGFHGRPAVYPTRGLLILQLDVCFQPEELFRFPENRINLKGF